MAWRGERPGVQRRLPPRHAKALSGRDREKLDPPASVRYRGLFASGVGRPPRFQDPGSAGSTRVVKCAVSALPPRSDFPPRRPPRNSEDVVIPFPPPCLQSIAPSLTKYASISHWRNPRG